MKTGQKILNAILPRVLFDALRRGTRQWLLECSCGHKRDLWDAGGVKGAGTEESTYKRCPQCGEWHWQKKRKKTSAELVTFPIETAISETVSGRIFRARSDGWATALVWGYALLIWGSAAVVLLSCEPRSSILLLVGLAIPIGYFAPWLLVTMRYRLTHTDLHLYSGIFHKQIPLQKIRRVRPAPKGAAISYSFSLEALQIELAGVRLGYRVAPADRPAFMAALAESCEQLVWRGDELVAKQSDEAAA